LSLEQIENEIEYNKISKENLATIIKQQEDKLLTELSEEMETEILMDIKSLKRKLESYKGNDGKLLEYKEMIIAVNDIMPSILMLLGSKV